MNFIKLNPKSLDEFNTILKPIVKSIVKYTEISSNDINMFNHLFVLDDYLTSLFILNQMVKDLELIFLSNYTNNLVEIAKNLN